MKKKKNATPDFEEQIQRLQVIVQELERSGLSLEQNVALYKEGRQLVQSCQLLLENAKNEILLCSEDGAVPFTEEAGEE